MEKFQADKGKFHVVLPGMELSDKGIKIDLQIDENVRISCDLRYGPTKPWPVTALSPGVMGPYGLVPFLECYHGVVSMDHS